MSEPITRTVRVKKVDDRFWQGDNPSVLSHCVGSAAGQSCTSMVPPPEVQSGTVTITFTPDPPDPQKIPWPWPSVNRAKISTATLATRDVFVDGHRLGSVGINAFGNWPAEEERIAVNDNGFVRLEKFE